MKSFTAEASYWLVSSDVSTLLLVQDDDWEEDSLLEEETELMDESKLLSPTFDSSSTPLFD
jgi:hypothetical protein